MFDESKFFGYFEPGVYTLLMDISEFGLQAAPDQVMRAGPRFYMNYINQVWFLLFAPGKRDCIMGHSDDIIRKTDEEDMYERRAAEEIVIAQKFDVKLEQDVSRGMARLVNMTNNLGGWDASMLQGNLQFAQYAEAILMLPGSHPAHMALVDNIFHPKK
jgi:hypothetical protein